MSDNSTMLPSVKALWLSDLRSGRFKQGRGVLREPDGKLCCLGVLAQRYDRIDNAGYGLPSPGESRMAGLVDPAFGLDSETQVLLADFNDIRKWDFSKIADWIEANVKTKAKDSESAEQPNV